MPSARARSGLSTIALMRVPVRLRPYQSSRRAQHDDADHDQQQAIARVGRAEYLDRAADRLVQALVAEARTSPRRTCAAAGSGPRSRPACRTAAGRAAAPASARPRSRARRRPRAASGIAATIRPALRLDDVGAVGADHHQLAVREIEHAEQAEHDREPEREERQRARSRTARSAPARRATGSTAGPSARGEAAAPGIRPGRRCRS